MLVYTPTYIHNQSQVVVLFQSGAGIEVLENQGQMAARLYLPLTFMVRSKDHQPRHDHRVPSLAVRGSAHR